MLVPLFALLAVVVATKSPDITPFVIDVPEATLEDLRTRLENTRLPDTVEPGNTWLYGSNLGVMKELLSYWKDGYDWRKQEAELNKMPQYKVEIGGFEVHFIHAKSKVPNAKPLLMVHGWPGSFWECSKVLPRLVDPEANGGTPADAFDLVCPSIPGFGFSSRPTSPGFDQIEAAKIMVELMHLLYPGQKYYLQGGDWGAIITALMAQSHPNDIIGYHTNFPMGTAPLGRGIMGILHTIAVSIAPSYFLKPHELEYWERASVKYLLTHTGYFHIQATKPQTIGYALNDSPLGLAAYIGEKFKQDWLSKEGDIKAFTKDELLTNIMIYWVSSTINSSIRFYYELLHSSNDMLAKTSRLVVKVPTACSIFPGEILPGIESFASYAYSDIKLWSVHEKGGHFAAVEQPELLVQDIRNFRKILENRSPAKNDL